MAQSNFQSIDPSFEEGELTHLPDVVNPENWRKDQNSPLSATQDKELKEAIKDEPGLTYRRLKRYTAKDIPYDIVRGEDDKGVTHNLVIDPNSIYFNRHANVSVFAAFDLNRKKWVALKEQSPQRFADTHDESLLLRQAKNITESYHFKVPERGSIFTVSPLESGFTVRKLPPQTRMIPGRWIQVGNQICNQLLQSHKQRILHRDISDNNVMIDNLMSHGKLIDFGLSKKIEGQGLFQFESDSYSGTPGFIAPEIATKKNHDKKIYNEKTDVFSLGFVLAELYGMRMQISDRPREFAITPLNFIENHKNLFGKIAHQRLPNKKLRKEMQDLLTKMTNPDPDVRISLPEVIETLNGIQEFCPDFRSNLKRTALVDLEEYAKSDHRRKEIFQALRLGQFDEIQFIDAKKSFKDQYISISENFKEQGITRIGKSVYHGKNTESILNTLTKRPCKDQQVRCFFHVTHNKKLKVNGIGHLPATSNHLDLKTEMAKHMRTQVLLDHQINFIVKQLENEIDRLINRYGKGNESKVDPKISIRISDIRETISTLHIAEEPITYADLETELKTLEGKMVRGGFMGRFFNNANTTGARNIAEIKKAVVSEDLLKLSKTKKI